MNKKCLYPAGWRLRAEKAELLAVERGAVNISLQNKLDKAEAELTALRDRVEGVSADEIKNLYDFEMGYSKNDCQNEMIRKHSFILDCEKCLTGCSIDEDRLFKAIQDLYKSKLVK